MPDDAVLGVRVSHTDWVEGGWTTEETVELSRREWSLLRALLQSPGRILSTEQLRDSLYGYSQDVESNAVNVHVHHLRRKLGHELVETVRGEGYRLGLHP